MGTRALITKNEKPFIATHWDGHPESLGQDLLAAGTTDAAIIKAALGHTIDAAHNSILPIINKGRYKKISEKTKGKYSPEDIAKLDEQGKMISFGIMEAGDYPISDIKNYGDFAEYQFDLKGGKWFFRPLGGEYPASVKAAGSFRPLTKESKS